MVNCLGNQGNRVAITSDQRLKKYIVNFIGSKGFYGLIYPNA
jgi:hypothetical protein